MLLFSSPEVDAFWREACKEAGIDGSSRRYALTFAEPTYRDGATEMINGLSALAASGQKRGTAHLRMHFERENITMREPGDYLLVTETSGKPVCLVRITNVAIKPFDEVAVEFAASEGEGDLSLAYWRKAHSGYFQRQCKRWGVAWRDDLPTVCESFELVYPI